MAEAARMPDIMRPDEIGPERILHVYDPATGMKGVVVIDTTVYGRATGGTRMLPDVTTAEIAGLARAMTYKYGQFGFPSGGAKAGIWADPTWDAAARTATLRAFGRALKPLFDAGAVGLGADMGTDALDTAVFREAAGMPSRGPSLALEEKDGEPLENHATGYGVVVAIRAACDCAGVDIKGATVAIEGFGKVGGGVARYLAGDGARVAAISNINGAIYNPEGLDIARLLDARLASGDGALQAYEAAQHIDREDLFTLPVDILVPGARTYVINGANADRVRAKIIASIANIPVTDEAEETLFRHGVCSVPDFISNVGGVVLGVVGAVGGTADDVFSSLERLVDPATRDILADSRREGRNPRDIATSRIRAKVLRARQNPPPPLPESERLGAYRQILGL
jgi:glutamate dehydrogenase (NAD(P)+)